MSKKVAAKVPLRSAVINPDTISNRHEICSPCRMCQLP